MLTDRCFRSQSPREALPKPIVLRCRLQSQIGAEVKPFGWSCRLRNQKGAVPSLTLASSHFGVQKAKTLPSWLDYRTERERKSLWKTEDYRILVLKKG